MKEKFIVSIISNLVKNISSLIANYILVLFLDVQLMGTWAFLQSVIHLGFMFSDLGLESIHYQYSGKENYNDFFGTFFTLKLGLLSLNITTSLTLISVLNLWNTPYILLILILLTSTAISNLLSIFLIQLRAKIKVLLIEIPTFIASLSQNITKIVIAYNLDNISDPLMIIALTNFILILVEIAIILSVSRKNFILNKPKKQLALNYLKDVKPLILVNILVTLSSNLGNIILNYAFSEIDLAYFYLVLGYIIPILGVISTSIITICLPLFSQFFAKNDIASLKKTVYLIEKYVSILFLSLILITFLTGKQIFTLILPKYLNSVPILYILMIASYTTGINRSYQSIFIPGEKQKIYSYIVIFEKLFLIFLYIILIPTSFFFINTFGLGAIGYAYAMIIPPIINVFIYRYLVKRKFNINPQKQILLHIAFAGISFLIVFILNISIIDPLIENQILEIIILISLSLGLFFGQLFIFKILKKEDIKFFFQLLKVRIYRKSIKEEIEKF